MRKICNLLYVSLIILMISGCGESDSSSFFPLNIHPTQDENSTTNDSNEEIINQGINIFGESGNTATILSTFTFQVKLNTQPNSNVILPISSTDETEGTVNINQLTFTPDNWHIAQTVIVTGQNDSTINGQQDYKIILAPTQSNDSHYNEIDLDDIIMLGRVLTINEPNFLSIPAGITSKLYFEINYNGKSSDLTIELLQEPTNMTLINGNILEWTPTVEDEGNIFPVTIKASDSLTSDEVSFNISVVSPYIAQVELINNELIITDDTTLLKGLRLSDSSTSLDTITIKLFDQNSVYPISSDLNVLGDIFMIEEDELSYESLRISYPDFTLPQGYILADVKLYQYSINLHELGSEQSGSGWIGADTNLTLININGVPILNANIAKTGLYFFALAPPVNPSLANHYSNTSTKTQICTPTQPDLLVPSGIDSFKCIKNGTDIYIQGYYSSVLSRQDNMSLTTVANMVFDTQNALSSTTFSNSFSEHITLKFEIQPSSDYQGHYHYVNFDAISISSTKDFSESLLLGTIAHEYFHQAQFHSFAVSTLNISFNPSASHTILSLPFSADLEYFTHNNSKWITEGTAKWFEDTEIFDSFNNYNINYTNILNVGVSPVVPTPLGDDGWYNRIGYWKLMEKSCPDALHLPTLMTNTTDSTYGLSMLSENIKECNFGSFFSTDGDGFAESLAYYSYATILKKDINLLDAQANEPISLSQFSEPQINISPSLPSSAEELKEEIHTINRFNIPAGGSVSFRIPEVSGEISPKLKVRMNISSSSTLPQAVLLSKSDAFTGTGNIDDYKFKELVAKETASTTKILEYTFENKVHDTFVIMVNPSTQEAITVTPSIIIEEDCTLYPTDNAIIYADAQWSSSHNTFELTVTGPTSGTNEYSLEDEGCAQRVWHIDSEADVAEGEYIINILPSITEILPETLTLRVGSPDGGLKFSIQLDKDSSFALGNLAKIIVTKEDGEVKVGVSTQGEYSNPDKNTTYITAYRVSSNGIEYEYETLTLINQANLGPIAEALFQVKALDDLDTLLYSSITSSSDDLASNGLMLFSTELKEAVQEDKLYLLSVKGGRDVDANDDFLMDTIPTENLGEIHAILNASSIQEGALKVSITTELAYQLFSLSNENNISKVNKGLDEIAQLLFKEDINSDEEINRFDLQRWIAGFDKDKLNLDYEQKIEPIVQKIYSNENIYLDAYKLLYANHVKSITVDSEIKSRFNIELYEFMELDQLDINSILIKDKLGNIINHTTVTKNENTLIVDLEETIKESTRYTINFTINVEDTNTDIYRDEHSHDIFVVDTIKPILLNNTINVVETKKDINLEIIDTSTIRIRILNGVDSTLFKVVTDGKGGQKLQFIQDPSFDAPLDSNSDNIYELTIEILDSTSNSIIESLQVTVIPNAAYILGEYELLNSYVQFTIPSQDGNYIYMGSSTGVSVLNIQDPSNIFLVASYAMSNGGAQSMVISNDNQTAYIAGSTSIDVVDISDPINLIKIGYTRSYYPKKLLLSHDENFLYVLGYFGKVEILNISVPTSPSGGKNLRVGTGDIRDFVLSKDGNFAYVATSTGLEVVNIEDLENQYQSDFYTLANMSKLELSQNNTEIFAITDGTYSLDMFHTSHGSLEPLHTMLLTHLPSSIVISSSDKKTVFIGSKNKKLTMININSYFDATIEGHYDTRNYPISMTLSPDNKTLYLPVWAEGLSIFDVEYLLP